MCVQENEISDVIKDYKIDHTDFWTRAWLLGENREWSSHARRRALLADGPSGEFGRSWHVAGLITLLIAFLSG